MGCGPIRSCAGCRRRRPQAELIRIVRRPDGTASVDSGTLEAPARGRPPARVPGRGAYVCRDESCADQAARSGALGRALRLEGSITGEIVAQLKQRIAAAAARSESEEERHG